jgi:hypothetical protein
MLTAISPLVKQDHLLFLTFDLAEPAGLRTASKPSTPSTVGTPEQTAREKASEEAGEWELNVGLGRALTDSTPQQWIGKVIVGRAF